MQVGRLRLSTNHVCSCMQLAHCQVPSGPEDLSASPMQGSKPLVTVKSHQHALPNSRAAVQCTRKTKAVLNHPTRVYGKMACLAAQHMRTASPNNTADYNMPPGAKATFKEQGFVLLPGVMSDEEMAQHIDPVYYKFLRGEIPVLGMDLCDMSGATGPRTPDQFTVYNIMLPRQYHPPWQGNLLEQRCKAIAVSLLGEDAALDFDQILAKRPQSIDSVMQWHQDKAYWIPLDSDPATANCWVAVSDVPLESGCMRYIPGSHLSPSLRKHTPVAASRADSHAIMADVDETSEKVVTVPMRRGDVLVHHERVVHGSGANLSDNWRCAYVLNFKHRACIDEERRKGFTHSHNDSVNWDKFLAATSVPPMSKPAVQPLNQALSELADCVSSTGV